MCLQCVAEGGTYLGGAVGALQVMKVRARSRRAPKGVEAEGSSEADDRTEAAPAGADA